MAAAKFTTAAFERSNGRKPSGRGTWAFQQTSKSAAFDRDRFGEVEFVSGTLTEAKAQMTARFGAGTMWAVMP